VTPMEISTIDQLQETHDLYKENIENWQFYRSAYKGGREFLEKVLFQHVRETDEAYVQRLKEAYSFSYPSSIVHLMNFFLTDTPPLRDPGPLADRKDWQRFMKNTDLYGTDIDVFINEAQKLAAIFGTVGIVVDKPGGVYVKGDMKKSPYLSVYTIDNVLDWNHIRNPDRNTYDLEYVKLRDGFHTYMIWTRNSWQRYELNKDESEIVDYQEGEHNMGQVPFIFMQNIRDIEVPYLGVSDLRDVAMICGSIARNISECEQVLKYSAFPMLRMPLEIDGFETDHANSDGEVVVGKEAVLDFNPEYGSGGKPDWLESAVGETVDGFLKWVDYTTEECFRGSLLSSLLVQRDKSQTKSGALLRVEQKQLSALLNRKAENMIETELKIVELWCKWQGCEELLENYEISKTRQFSIDDLADELSYTFDAVAKVPSELFAKSIYKKVTNTLLPNLPISDLAKIEKEIDSAKLNIGDVNDGVVEKNKDDTSQNVTSTLTV